VSEELPKPCGPKPCDDCPFRVNALPGWLGPWTAQGMQEHVLREGYFSCHKTIDSDGQPLKETTFCTGALLHLSRCCAVPRDLELRDAMARAVDLQEDGWEQGILALQDFVPYHTLKETPNAR